MRFLVVNFSISNGGDYLIEERMNSIIQRTWPLEEVVSVNGISGIGHGELNQYDAVFLGGGPYFDDRIIKELFIPFIGKNDYSYPSVHIIGAGIYGNDCTDEGIYSRQFMPDTKQFFKDIENGGGTFGCRDEISYRVMKHNGLSRVYMTGCPAWYDFSMLDNTEIRYDKEIKKVIISDPGVTKDRDEQSVRAEQAIGVILAIKEIFPDAEICFTFNNGIETKYSKVCNTAIRDFLTEKEIEYHDLSFNANLFRVYNGADLHIGFRVHSHIYSLSRRIPSILIEEDLRGYGMNETFGLPHLLSFDISERLQKRRYKPNTWLNRHMTDLIQYNLETGFMRYEGAYQIMKSMYYRNYTAWAKAVNSSLKNRK